MKIGFYSTMTGVPWGGSEVLWSRVAHRLLDAHLDVTVNYRWWENEPRALSELRSAGASVWLRRDPTWRSWPYRLKPPFDLEDETKHLQRWITREQPNAVMVTLGYHLDPVLPASELIRRGIPYAINVQSVSTDTLDDQYLDEFRMAYTHARKVYFVSHENRVRVETNLAMKLENAVVIDNPFNVSWNANPDWPSDEDGWRLACVARIHYASKGQDVLIQLLSQEKWRNRNLSVHLFGNPQGNLRQTQELIERFNLQASLQIAGYAEYVEAVWAKHHGLVLPSRFEGAALAVVEALLCNRICITTDVGRNRELIDDGESGFIAPAATEELFDQTLEAAWQQREQWQSMGQLAGVRVRERYGDDPVAAFQDEIMQLAATNG